LDGALRASLCLGNTTMIIIGLILSALGAGFFCWLLFTLAIYALPAFAGLTVAFAAFHVGSGLIGAAAAGVVVAAVLLAIGRFTFAMVQSPILKFGVILLYALPAAVAGYSVTLGLATSAYHRSCGVRGSR
jgi:hypothetical protein